MNGQEQIRIAEKTDLEQIVLIYNQAVRAGFETADTREVSIDSMSAWFDLHEPDRFPIFVYEQDSRILGWISTSPYRNGRQAVRFTAELSYYVDQRFRGKKIATRLMLRAIGFARTAGYRSLFAVVIERNIASLNLLRKFEYEEWGCFPGVVNFNGATYDHLYWGLQLTEPR